MLQIFSYRHLLFPPPTSIFNCPKQNQLMEVKAGGKPTVA
jgi:hypothetical protein